MLQAFVDDSGSEPQSPVFILAGHISTPEKWAKFADEWRDALARSPGAVYFKASEAMSLRGEFSQSKGWDDQTRDERVIELCEVIWRHATVAISAQMMHQDWADTFKRLAPVFAALPTKRFSHPHAFLWFTMLHKLWLHPTKLTLANAGPCDFIVDEMVGYQEEMISLWSTMKAFIDQPPLPDKMRAWIGSPPIFRDEKLFLPLQAADLWAWANRRAVVSPPDRLKLPEAAIERLCAIPPMHLNVNRDYLAAEVWRMIEDLKRFFDARRT